LVITDGCERGGTNDVLSNEKCPLFLEEMSFEDVLFEISSRTDYKLRGPALFGFDPVLDVGCVLLKVTGD
jgi:hypothetical protein